MSNCGNMKMLLERAVADFNRHNSKRIRLAMNSLDDGRREGFLFVDNQEIEIRSESGFGSDETSICVMLLPLRQDTLLAGLDARQFFNLVAAVEPGVSLAFEPQIRMESEMIRVIGVEAAVALKCVNRHSLEDMVGRLLVSAGCLQSILSGDAGSRDYWHERLSCASRITGTATSGVSNAISSLGVLT